MEGLSLINEALGFPKDIVLFSHRNPDGDAMGSSLGLKLFLEQAHHNVSVIYPSEYPATLSFLPGSDDALIYDYDQAKCKQIIEKAQILFFLDFSGLDRIDKMGELVLEHEALKIHIDHHLDPEPFADYVLSRTDASSTSELVFEFISMLPAIGEVTAQISECLLTGIITDTGSFKYNANPLTFSAASKLLTFGTSINVLQDKIFNRQSEKYIRLLGHCLANRIEIMPNFRTGIIWLTKEDYNTFDIQRGDTEGIVNYLLMINNIDVAAFITEQPKIVKLSLRSRGDISVQEMARDHFKGGGHKNASGGAAYGKLETVIKKFKSILPFYLNKS